MSGDNRILEAKAVSRREGTSGTATNRRVGRPGLALAANRTVSVSRLQIRELKELPADQSERLLRVAASIFCHVPTSLESDEAAGLNGAFAVSGNCSIGALNL